MTEGPAAPACAGGGSRPRDGDGLEQWRKQGPGRRPWGETRRGRSGAFADQPPGSGGDRAVCLLFEVSYECLEGMLWDRFVGTEVWGVTVEAAKGRGTRTDRSPREARCMRWRSRRGGREDVAPALITLS